MYSEQNETVTECEGTAETGRSRVAQGFAGHAKFCLRNSAIKEDFKVSNMVTHSSLKCHFSYWRLKGEIYFFVLFVLSLL